jgi:hypothetical protein
LRHSDALVLQMVGAVRMQPRADRRCAEPFADPIVDFRVRVQRAMRGVVHQNGEAKLARADQHHSEHIGQRIGPHDEHRGSRKDKSPGACDEHEPLPR